MPSLSALLAISIRPINSIPQLIGEYVPFPDAELLHKDADEQVFFNLPMLLILFGTIYQVLFLKFSIHNINEYI